MTFSLLYSLARSCMLRGKLAMIGANEARIKGGFR